MVQRQNGQVPLMLRRVDRRWNDGQILAVDLAA